MTNIRKIPVAFLFAALLTLTFGGTEEASAAEKHGHGAQHGGQIIELDHHQAVEMVTKGTEITFYISENDKPAKLHGGAFRVFVQSAAGMMTSGLKINGNRLEAKLDKAVPVGAKVVVTGKDSHGHVIQARFVKK